MIPDKKLNRHKRTIYTRILERFVNKCVSFVSKEEIEKEDLNSFIDKHKGVVENAHKVPLHSEYFSELEKFVQWLIYLPSSSEKLEDLRPQIFHSANKLRKIQRQKTFKKDKHKKRDFDKEF